MKIATNILAVLLLISIGGNVWQYFSPRTIKAKGKVVRLPSDEKPQVIIYELPSGNQSATVKNSLEYKKATKEAQELIETVKSIPALENTDKITSLTEAKMKLELELKAKDMTLNDLATQKKTWEDKFNKIMVDNANNTATVQSEVSPKVATVEKRDGFLKPKETYTVISAENPSLKFYGMESYTFKNPVHKDFLELNVKLQGLYLDNVLIPYGGAELLFNPDGKLKPIVGYGYFYDNGTKRFLPYWMGGLQYNLIRF